MLCVTQRDLKRMNTSCGLFFSLDANANPRTFELFYRHVLILWYHEDVAW